MDDGRIIRDQHGFTCAPLDHVVLPETVNSVVRAKLEGLGEALRLTMETACVIGEEFRFETLQTALAVPEDELEALLEDAVHRRLLSEEGWRRGATFGSRAPRCAACCTRRCQSGGASDYTARWSTRSTPCTAKATPTGSRKC